MIGGAANSDTVDWSKWMTLTPKEQRALWERYRSIVKSESDEALRTKYAKLNAALRGHG